MNSLPNTYEVHIMQENTNDPRVIASNFIEEGSVVLDVGCACGDFGEFITRTKKCNVYGMEYNAESVKKASDKNVFKNIHQIDLNIFETTTYNDYYNKFGYITLLDVLEHVIDPISSLSRLMPYLKKDGYIVISLPNVSFGDIKVSLLNDDFKYTDTGILDKTHLRFFTYKSIADFMSSVNLEILDCQVVVAGMESDNIISSRSLRSNILGDHHSFVYQYIIKLKFSTQLHENLIKNNISKMSLTKKQVLCKLNKTKVHSLMFYLSPFGSRRRLLIKKLIKMIGVKL